MTNNARADQEGKRAILRMPGVAMLGVAFLAICMTPIAFTVPGMLALYIFPIAIAYWLIRTRTTADRHGLSARYVFGKQDVAWSELKGLQLTKRGHVHAVTNDGTEIALPTVRARHLPVLSLVSEGALPDPSGVTEQIIADEQAASGKDSDQRTGDTASGE